ncbi:MAG: type II secretion system GspH family protein [Campylobacter sp.]|uniref:type II secretion system protein n=1 Tax=Campylobacter sp. TaxID=205 RepID=UPI002AA88A8C|nr:type II secretion system protein [Campylobacter sp.]MCI6343421.1 type II secretion system GspH family protein [Campylobacter sp.]MCI7362715.1 type II secretion system GspH family protein [Campylobacter sp.]
MKKGFTMIELIFVIVILGILASVAIPRLAATREDAEISAAVANLRTLVSDATAYYVAKGSFNTTGATKAKWSEITNVPLDGATSTAVNGSTATAKLKAGGKDCIGVRLVNKTGTTPAHIVFSKETAANSAGVCKQVADSDSVKKAYLDSTVKGADNQNITGAVAIGSSTSVY